MSADRNLLFMVPAMDNSSEPDSFKQLCRAGLVHLLLGLFPMSPPFCSFSFLTTTLSSLSPISTYDSLLEFLKLGS